MASKDRDCEVLSIVERVTNTLAPFLDPRQLKRFVDALNITYIDMYLDVHLVYNTGMDDMRNGDGKGLHNVSTSLMPLYTITNKVNYLPLAL